ncbi:hypothetical protein [Pontibacter sp. H249]|uniref:hypothetical protein n=1 Tax=Pontibacter sp. H249 TaxID=3133420 RepID=UPI0030C5568C
MAHVLSDNMTYELHDRKSYKLQRPRGIFMTRERLIRYGATSFVTRRSQDLRTLRGLYHQKTQDVLL